MKQRLVPIIAAILTALPIIAIFSPLIFGYGRTSTNTKLLGLDYSLLSKDQVIQKINTDFVPPAQVEFNYQDASFPLALSEINYQIDAESTANNIISKNLNQGLFQYLDHLIHSQDNLLEVKFDQEIFNQKIASISSQIEKPFIPTEFQLVTQPNNSQTVVAKQGQLGLTIDESQLLNSFISLSKRHDFQSIAIPVVNQGLIPSEADLDNLLAQANSLIGKKLLLRIDSENTTEIDDKTLISWFDFQSGFNSEKITQYVDNINQSFKRDPVDAVFQVESGKVLEFRPAKEGLTIDTEQLTSDLPNQIKLLIASSEKQVEYQIPTTSIKPQVNTADVNDLGIKELLGKGTSTFHHSSATRNKNVEKGASVVNRVLVAPGDTFSFIKSLGEVSVESGYYMAYVIRGGKTELDVGGGICQVSTTLFRAMLNSGLDITHRQNHAYRVSYYEEDMPPGYDATVFIPNPDLTFINDTGNYVLIQNTYDGVNKSLTYEIWGTSDGRQTEISNYRQWGASAPPPDVYIDDPTLPPGKVIQIESRVPGLKTSFDWKVVRDGQTIHQKTYTSTYTPWAAVFRRGPQI